MLFGKTTRQRLEVFYYSSILGSFLEGKECFQIARQNWPGANSVSTSSRAGTTHQENNMRQDARCMLIIGPQWQLHSALRLTDSIRELHCNPVRSSWGFLFSHTLKVLDVWVCSGELHGLFLKIKKQIVAGMMFVRVIRSYARFDAF